MRRGYYRSANRRTTAEVIADIEKALAAETTPEGKAQLEKALEYWKGKGGKDK